MSNNENVTSLDLLQTVLPSAHGFELTRAESTHDPALQFVGQVVVHTKDEEEICALVTSLLPKNYKGDTLKEVPQMLSSAIEKGFHKPKAKAGNSKNETQSVIALRLVKKRIKSLLRTPNGKTYTQIAGPEGGSVCYAINSTEIRKLIGHCYYKEHGKPLPRISSQEVIEQLQAEAMFEGEEQGVNVRIAHQDNATYIDTGRRDCKCIKINASGFDIIDEVPVNFVRPQGFGELPLPEPGGEFDELKELLGLDDQAFLLTIMFLVAFFCPNGAKFGMIMQGEQGSGKSVLSSVIKKLLDPSLVERSRMPKSEHELAIMAGQQALLVFDNASSIQWELSDFLCTLLTGGSMMVRRLYTEDESYLFHYKRAMLMNGIGDYANRPDLLERCVQTNLKAMPENSRKTESEIDQGLERIAPTILHQLYECVSHAYKTLDDVDPPRNIRMSDAAQWVMAAEPATDFDDGSFIDALVKVQKDMMAERVINDPLAMAVIALLEKENKNYNGTVGDLFTKLQQDETNSRNLPKTAAHLSNRLKRLMPAMAKIGLVVEFGERNRDARPISIRLEGDLTGNGADHDI